MRDEQTKAQLIEELAKLEATKRDLLEEIKALKNAAGQTPDHPGAMAPADPETNRRARRTFWTNMSQEIRTPLNAIIGYAQQLDKLELEEDSRHNLVGIQQTSDRLLRLVENVFDLERMESGYLEVRQEPFDLVDLVQNLGQIFALYCRQRGLTWRIACPVETLWVRGDAGKVRQVLIQLLDYAVQRTREGPVTLELKSVGASRYGFVVSDSGEGMSAEQRAKLFDHPPGEQFQPGAELGLGLAQRFVQWMGGSLEVEPAPRGGSQFCFWLSLPAIAADEVGNASVTEGEFERLQVPAELRAQLRRAAEMHNVTELKRHLEVLQDLGEREARMATQLGGLVQAFNMPAVMEILAETVDA